MGFGVSDMKPAVTNCILVDSEGKEMFKMFKCRQKIHSMRFAHPLRPLHLFAFALSSFDFKLFCQ